MNTIYEKLDEKAYKLLERSGAISTPVDLDQVSDHLGLAVVEKPLEEEFSGFLAVKEKTIVINAQHSRVRRRFTTAHEIGHYFLHRKSQQDTSVFIDRTVYYRRQNLDDADRRIELEANGFAAGLLMPRDLLESYLDESPNLNLGKSSEIKILADEFEVSRSAMEYRLQNLGFILKTSV